MHCLFSASTSHHSVGMTVYPSNSVYSFPINFSTKQLLTQRSTQNKPWNWRRMIISKCQKGNQLLSSSMVPMKPKERQWKIFLSFQSDDFISCTIWKKKRYMKISAQKKSQSDLLFWSTLLTFLVTMLWYSLI